MHMLSVMIVGLAMGTTISIGQAVGSGDRKRASACTGNTVTLFLGLSLVLAAALLCLRRPIVALLSTPAEAVEGTVAYLTVCFIGIPFITAYNILSSIFRGLGDSKSPMYFIAVACVVNIGLDLLFMGPMHLGPIGAALGTTLSQAVSVAVSLLVIVKRNTGAGKPERAKATLGCAIAITLGCAIAITLGCAIAITLGFTSLIVILVEFLAEPMVGLFTPDDTVIHSGGQYLLGYIWDCFFAGVQFSFSGYFCAIGRSGLSFLHNTLSILLVRIPGAYLASRFFPATLLPMGLANATGSLFSILVCLIAYGALLHGERRGHGALSDR